MAETFVNGDGYVLNRTVFMYADPETKREKMLNEGDSLDGLRFTEEGWETLSSGDDPAVVKKDRDEEKREARQDSNSAPATARADSGSKPAGSPVKK